MYTISKDQKVVMRDDGAFIPVDDGNYDYKAFLEWQQGGGLVSQEADKPDFVDAAKEANIIDDLVEAVHALLDNDQDRINSSKANISKKVADSGITKAMSI